VRKRRQCNAPTVYWCKRRIKRGSSGSHASFASITSVRTAWWGTKLSTAMEIVIIEKIVPNTSQIICYQVTFVKIALAAM
jgi:hypothetical protein